MNAMLKAHSEHSVFTERTAGSSRLVPSLPLQGRAFPAVLGLATLVGIAVLFLLLYPWVPARAHTHCETMSCKVHRDLIDGQLDLTVDPCDDFRAHVCGNWRHRKFSDFSTSALSDMVAQRLIQLRALLKDGVDKLPAGKRAAAMFNSCMTQTGSQVDVVQEFMRARGLMWPEQAEEGGSPLDVMFDLAFNWSVNLWFKMKFLPSTPAHPYRRIFFSHSNRMTVWRAIFKNIPRTKHDYVYGALFRLFSNTTDSYPVKEEIARTYDMLEYVFDLLIRPGTSTARTPVQFALRSWENHSLIESAEDVRRALNSVLRIKPPLTPDDLILFSNLALLKGMSNIFNKFKDRLVRRHLAWLFVWAYGIMANPAAILEVMHGDKTRAEQSRIRYCAAQVEANYKLLVAAMTIASYFPSEKRALIDEHLSGIVEAFDGITLLGKKGGRRMSRKLGKDSGCTSSGLISAVVVYLTYSAFDSTDDFSCVRRRSRVKVQPELEYGEFCSSRPCRDKRF
ncbi:membrane metallo-endopeptidase-like 1 [Amblyomma americanum]